MENIIIAVIRFENLNAMGHTELGYLKLNVQFACTLTGIP